ncbi:DNA-binding protein [Pasteurellaceae bacterium LFhippo2]|nr:DNA-binding protein [Pasteurellaceae bacterium LFhippo2]
MESKPHKERFIKIDEVIAVTSLSETTIYRKMKAKEFPESISLGTNSKVWLESEIQQWITDQVNNQRNK